MKGIQVALLMGVVGCGAGSHLKIQFSSADSTADGGTPTVQMQTGEARTVELVVIGAASGPVTFSGTNLPAFATLQGPILTLAPQRMDAGDYTLTLTVTAGRDSSNADLHLSITRPNTAPTWTMTFPELSFGDDNGPRFYSCPSPSYCTAGPNPYMSIAACDAEGDDIVVDVEVVLRGQAFSKHPTFSTRSPNGNCRGLKAVMPGLAPGNSYDFSIRVSDQFGAVTQVPGAVDGWYHPPGWGFDQGPCTTRQCACMPYGSYHCAGSLDCCGGLSCQFWQTDPAPSCR